MPKKKTSKSKEPKPQIPEPEIVHAAKIVDPIGDTTDGEARTALEVGPAVEAEIEASGDSGSNAAEAPANAEAEDKPELEFKPRPPAKLDRLQKILAQAGVASRRKAEELIEQGRVQVNGKVVTELGTKADAGRDHIRVDGKLLHGAERLRYFVLNKPRGFVTTVKDPEGRPTVMQFFEKMSERLYPVGRLDYMSEGLLLVTNDGELANRLTRAAAGVEKTYLVKVAGQPTEAELDLLRSGVAIERGKPGSPKVHTSPARIRQVRQGDNPWYEVVLIEGRNRELRKMFEEVGHFVEKIRRVGYGPLVLDQEPGNLRELDPEELVLLRKAADGTLRTPKSKAVRRRNLSDAQLPTVAPRPTGVRPTGARPAKPFGDRPHGTKSFEERPAPGPKDYRPKKSIGEGKPFGPGKSFGQGPSQGMDRASSSRPARPAWNKDARPDRPPARFGAGSTGESRPPAAGKPFADGPSSGRSFGAKPAWSKQVSNNRQGSGIRPPYKRPAASRRESPIHDEDLGPVRPPNLHIEEIHESDRTASNRPGSNRSASSHPSAPRPYLGRTDSHRLGSSRPSAPQASSPQSGSFRPSAPYPRPASGRLSSNRPGPDLSGTGRSSSARSFRSEGGSLARPFTTSSGKPRAGGARPSSKSGASTAGRSSSAGWKPSRPTGGYDGPRSGSGSRPAGLRPTGSSGSSGSSRPYTPRGEGASNFRPNQTKPYPNSAARTERKAVAGWKPKPSFNSNFGGPGKPTSSARSKPKPGSGKSRFKGAGFKGVGFKGSGYKGKPSGPRRTSAPGGKKRS